MRHRAVAEEPATKTTLRRGKEHLAPRAARRAHAQPLPGSSGRAAHARRAAAPRCTKALPASGGRRAPAPRPRLVTGTGGARGPRAPRRGRRLSPPLAAPHQTRGLQGGRRRRAPLPVGPRPLRRRRRAAAALAPPDACRDPYGASPALPNVPPAAATLTRVPSPRRRQAPSARGLPAAPCPAQEGGRVGKGGRGQPCCGTSVRAVSAQRAGSERERAKPGPRAHAVSRKRAAASPTVSGSVSAHT